MVIAADPSQPMYRITGDILGEDELRGVRVATYSREINLRTKEAYSALFEVTDEAQKKGIGKKLLAGNVETYEKLGIEKVKVTAGLTVGGYAWAKYGYVPQQDDWDSLRSILKNRIEGGGSRYSGNAGTDTVEADSWDQLSESVQDQVRSRWREDTFDDFMEQEISNWRDSYEPMREARQTVAGDFNGGGVMDMPTWAEEAMETLHEVSDEDEDAVAVEYPYSDKQLYAAMKLVNADDDEATLELEWNEDKLNTYVPPGHAPGQLTLPSIEEVKPADYLTPDMRKDIEMAILSAAESRAEDEQINVEPPEYLRETVQEYMTEWWEDVADDDARLEMARRHDLHHIEIEPDEEVLEAVDVPIEELEIDPVLAALNDPDPKAIWRVANSARGKELLLKQGWTGKLDMKDAEVMKRFKEYVGRVKKNA